MSLVKKPNTQASQERAGHESDMLGLKGLLLSASFQKAVRTVLLPG